MITDVGRRRTAVTAMFLLNGLIGAGWVARIPQVKERIGLDDETLGAALLGAPAGLVLAVRFAGEVAERWGERATVLGGGTVAALALVPMGLAPNLPSLVAALLVFGGSLGLMDVAMNAQGVRVERASGRPLMSGFHGAFSLGALAGALSGSAAAASAISVGVHLLLLASVVVALVWALGRGLATSPAGAPSQIATASAPAEELSCGGIGGNTGPFAAVQHRSALLRLGLIGLCAFVGEGAMADWSAVFLRENLHTAPGIAGLGYAGFAGCMTSARLSGNAWLARFRPSHVLRVGSSVAALGLAGGLAVGNPVGTILGFSLFGAGVAVVAPVIFGAAGSLPGIPPATGLSRVTSIGYLGMLGGPPLIGLIAQAVGLRSALIAVAAMAAVIALLADAVRGAATT